MRFEINDVVRTYEVDGDFAKTYRIEILRSVSEGHYSARAYEMEEDGETGLGAWKIIDFPWLSAKKGTEEEAVEEANSWLEERVT